jgi:carbamate kinase
VLIVAALGRNALLRRGESLDVQTLQRTGGTASIGALGNALEIVAAQSGTSVRMPEEFDDEQC